ncbi:MAG TPA: squalene synthase HpnC [Solirubrobacteraceae bacterium]|jgi:squalene synthase HpnC|nr:squalene synthase HpnC [Solirubrobacteraceae bacterium]
MSATAAGGAAVAGVAALPTREQVLPQAGRENFTVASGILGRRRARHLMAIYGFARLVDDVGDEAIGDRAALLDVVAVELHRAFAEPGLDGPQHPLMQGLAETVRECRLPIGPFERLIDANRMDQVLSRYESFPQLLEYCQLSAAPVGELVLGVFGAATANRVALSDRVCAGLQVVEHLQDIAEDHSRGRVYMPREDLERFGCDERDLAAAGQPSANLRALISFEATRARALLGSGGPLARTLQPMPRLAIAGFTAGGLRALEQLEQGRSTRPAYMWKMLRTAAGR